MGGRLTVRPATPTRWTVSRHATELAPGQADLSAGYPKMVIENTYYESVKDPYYRDDTAQLRQVGSICVSCSGQQETGGSAFTPSSFYSYRLDPASAVPNMLRTYAGPQAAIGL